jgi:hypothetical protein
MESSLKPPYDFLPTTLVPDEGGEEEEEEVMRVEIRPRLCSQWLMMVKIHLGPEYSSVLTDMKDNTMIKNCSHRGASSTSTKPPFFFLGLCSFFSFIIIIILRGKVDTS